MLRVNEIIAQSAAGPKGKPKPKALTLEIYRDQLTCSVQEAINKARKQGYEVIRVINHGPDSFQPTEPLNADFTKAIN